MKYYAENRVQQIRQALEAAVLKWPQVKVKMMFGCPGYRAGNKLFAFLVTGGVVLTCLSPRDRESLAKKLPIESFRARGKAVANWVKIAVACGADLKLALPYVKKSYQGARRDPGWN